MSCSTGFSISAVALSVVTGALAAAGKTECSAREAILSGLGNTLLLSLLTCLSVCIREAEPFIRKAVLALLTLGLAAELAETILQAQQAAQGCHGESRQENQRKGSKHNKFPPSGVWDAKKG